MVNRVFVWTGGTVGLYMGIVGLDVYRTSQGEQRLQAEVVWEKRHATTAEAAAKREEAAIAGFQEAIQLQQQGVATVDAEITVVQQQLEELQGLREARLKDVADSEVALEEARSKLTRLVADARRHQHAATAAEQALARAHKHTLAAKQGINPLQHPLVRSFTGRS